MGDLICVDLDEVLSAVRMQKAHVKRSLIRDFEEGVDYTVHRSGTSGRPANHEVIAISKKCRDQLLVQYAIRSRTPIDTSSIELVYMKRYVPKEAETLDFVKRALAAEYFGAMQYSVGRYRIDLYFPSQRVAIECDENGHSDRDAAKDAERQANIDCVFIRFNPDDDSFDLAELISDVLCALRQGDRHKAV